MTHWGWYWRIKKQHKPKVSCSNFGLTPIDSFEMYNNYRQVEEVRNTPHKRSLVVPRYDLIAYLQDDDSLRVEYNQGTYSIPVERKPCNFGGYYYFFHCPLCKKRMRKLYCLEDKYQCRKCANLGYYSQRLRPVARLRYKNYKVIDYVKNHAGSIRFDEKPPRMHKKTFQRLKDQAAYYMAKSDQEGYKEIRLWYGPQAGGWIDGSIEYESRYIIEKYEKKYIR